jgi:hypothetical protein
MIMLRLYRTAPAWALPAATAAALLAGVSSAGAATIPMILFDDGAVGGGSLSYAGAGGAVSGTNIPLVNIIGSSTPSNDEAELTCEDCSLNFVSGANDYETPIWAFLPGGSVAVTGVAKDDALAVATGTLLRGVFNDTTFVSEAGSSRITVSGSMDVTLNDALAAFYGTSTQGLAVMTQINSLAEPVDLSSNAFQGTSVLTGINSLSAIPVPTTLPLFLSALAGITMISRRGHPAST